MPARAAIIIPARLSSRRFPRKVLARETGKYLIEHVYERVAATPGVSTVVIATDSAEVESAARSFGAEVAMTSPDHLSGTDRVAEAARRLDVETVINVQGDEPLADPKDLTRLIAALDPQGLRRSSMATLARPRFDAGAQRDPNIVKVVLDASGRALYFSRAPIPSGLESAAKERAPWLQHIGVYGFEKSFLEAFTRLPPGKLERLERLEQLRALENGHAIDVLLTDNEYRGIDTEEEYRAFVEAYRAAKAFA